MNTEDKIIQLRNMIETGYGRTNKPIPANRMKRLKKTLLFYLEISDTKDEQNKMPIEPTKQRSDTTKPIAAQQPENKIV